MIEIEIGMRLFLAVILICAFYLISIGIKLLVAALYHDVGFLFGDKKDKDENQFAR